MKGKGTVKIDISDLDKYIRGARDLAPNPVTDWMALKSQLQVNGLKSFHNALKQERPRSLTNIKTEYSVLLLSDLELVSKRCENLSLWGKGYGFATHSAFHKASPPAFALALHRGVICGWSRSAP